MQRMQIEAQLAAGCRRLAGKGFFHSPAESFSMRAPEKMEMILAAGHSDWRHIEFADLQTVSIVECEGVCGLHASIYRQRADVGAIAISTPKGARLLAGFGGLMPPIFDEQVRHIGGAAGPLPDGIAPGSELVQEAFGKGANAALLGKQLLCLGMTCERVLFNTELYEKCAQAYLLAKASGSRIGHIPLWVRIIASRRLLKDERRAAESYRNGRVPESMTAY